MLITISAHAVNNKVLKGIRGPSQGNSVFLKRYGYHCTHVTQETKPKSAKLA